MELIPWGRLVPGAVVERGDGRKYRVVAINAEEPGAVRLVAGGDDEEMLEVKRDVRARVRAWLPDDVVAAEYAARNLPATIVCPPVPNSRLALHLFAMHGEYVEPKYHKDYAALRQWHDRFHAERRWAIPHEHRAGA